jgi:hypothetical protein
MPAKDALISEVPGNGGLYDRIFALRTERDRALTTVHWTEITREIEEETERIGHLLAKLNHP